MVCVVGSYLDMVGVKGLEPLSLAAADFKSAASANSATPPQNVCESHSTRLYPNRSFEVGIMNWRKKKRTNVRFYGIMHAVK